MVAVRSRRSDRRSSRVWWRWGRADRYAAGWNSVAKKSVRGSAAGNGKGRSSSVSDELEEARLKGDAFCRPGRAGSVRGRVKSAMDEGNGAN